MSSRVVDKYIARVESSIKKQANFNTQDYKKELTDKLKTNYTELTNMKLNVARVINSMEGRLDEASVDNLNTIYKQFDKVTNPLETLLAICMGTPTKATRL